MGMFQPQQNPVTSVFGGLKAAIDERAALAKSAQSGVDGPSLTALGNLRERQLEGRRSTRADVEALIQQATPGTLPRIARTLQDSPGLFSPQEIAGIKQGLGVDDSWQPVDAESGFGTDADKFAYWSQNDQAGHHLTMTGIYDTVQGLSAEDFANPQVLDQKLDAAWSEMRQMIAQNTNSPAHARALEKTYMDGVAHWVETMQGIFGTAQQAAGREREAVKDQERRRADVMGAVRKLWAPSLLNQKDVSMFSFMGGDPWSGFGNIDPTKAAAGRALDSLAAKFYQPGMTPQAIAQKVRAEVEANPDVYGQVMQEAVRMQDPLDWARGRQIPVPVQIGPLPNMQLESGHVLKWADDRQEWVISDGVNRWPATERDLQMLPPAARELGGGR